VGLRIFDLRFGKIFKSLGKNQKTNRNVIASGARQSFPLIEDYKSGIGSADCRGRASLAMTE